MIPVGRGRKSNILKTDQVEEGWDESFDHSCFFCFEVLLLSPNLIVLLGGGWVVRSPPGSTSVQYQKYYTTLLCSTRSTTAVLQIAFGNLQRGHGPLLCWPKLGFFSSSVKRIFWRLQLHFFQEPWRTHELFCSYISQPGVKECRDDHWHREGVNKFKGAFAIDLHKTLHSHEKEGGVRTKLERTSP